MHGGWVPAGVRLRRRAVLRRSAIARSRSPAIQAASRAFICYNSGMSDYDTDILLWSQRQAELLRRLAAGEPVNEAPDWPNIVEEIESVGNEQLHAVTSLLRQALIHILKA